MLRPGFKLGSYVGPRPTFALIFRAWAQHMNPFWSHLCTACNRQFVYVAKADTKSVEQCWPIESASFGKVVLYHLLTNSVSSTVRFLRNRGGSTPKSLVINGSPAVTRPTNWSPAFSRIRYLFNTPGSVHPARMMMAIIDGEAVLPDAALLAAPLGHHLGWHLVDFHCSWQKLSNHDEKGNYPRLKFIEHFL